MKRQIVMWSIIAVVFFVISAFAMHKAAFGQEWTATNQATVAWDASALATSYETFTKKADGSDIQPAGVTVIPEYTFTFTVEGAYFVGALSVREIDGEILRSTISWSDNSIVCKDGVAFGFKYYMMPDAVMNMRRK